MKIGDIITVKDAHTDAYVPAIVTAVADDGTASVTVFGTSDVVEKLTGVTDSATTPDVNPEDPTPIAEPVATGTRRATTNEGEK